MALQNSLTKATGKQTFSAFLTSDAVKNQINNIVGGKDGQKFISAIVSAVSVNPGLAECENSTILSAALLGQSLNLSPSPQMGYYYIVPYNDKKNNRKVATFTMGYKGMYQLAIRSGQYKKINVLAIKEGELKYFDPLNEEIEVELMVDNWDEREEAPTIGYYAFFELGNGFRKAIYWSKKQMINHADKYSMAFSKDTYKDIIEGKIPEKDMWKYSSFWYKNFDDMAKKTMLRQLLSKYGVMSTEMQQAYERDDTYEAENGKAEYVSNEVEIVTEESVVVENIQDALFDNE